MSASDGSGDVLLDQVVDGAVESSSSPPDDETAPVDVANDPEQDELRALLNLPLEELLNVPVTSLEGVGRPWFKTPAAMYVITGDEVRRSGHRSLAEALRMAPGTFVGQINSQSYAISTRGFNGGLANKTLVLIDGRTVYDPLFSGTFWNVQDILLEDLDRIEVTRGPGPTLWGANAVNGVINIITKSAKDTQGWFIGAGGGTFERAFGEARYGTALSEHSWLRAYGKWFERGRLEAPGPDDGHDDWAMGRGGFRFDLEGADDFTFTLQGDAYHSDRIGERVAMIPVPGEHFTFRTDIRDSRNSGGNMLFRMGQDREAGGWQLQGYYDRTERTTNAGFRAHRDTYDLDFRNYFDLGTSHEIMWGLEARHTSDRVRSGPNLLFPDGGRSLDTFSVFIQDTITLVPERWFAMVGSKFEHNDQTGFEAQPSARLWWTPNDRNMLWGAVSRAVRVPSRTETDGLIRFGFVDTGLVEGGPPTGVIVPLDVIGNDDLESEELIAYELGYRRIISSNLSVDFATFYNDYSRLIFVPGTVVGMWNNDGRGETYGGEIAASWQVAENWRLESSYSFVQVRIHGPIFGQDEQATPRHMAQLRSYYALTDDLELNSALYYVDAVPAVNADAYLRFDLGLIWRPTNTFELAVWGQNLFDPRHREFSGLEVERGVYVMGSLRF